MRGPLSHVPQITLDESTVDELDSLRFDDESYDEIVTELINIYEAQEFTIQYGSNSPYNADEDD